MKRALDLALAGLGLLVLAPLLAAIAVAVKLDSPGPVLFRQERVGRGGRPFRMLKFRTMAHDPGRHAVNVCAAGDARVTRVGALLRRSFLDEAPQLLNVLAGHMSLVGPRPETPEHAALLTAGERRLWELRPGMAGPSTLAFSRDEAELLARQDDPARYYVETLLHDRARADLAYLERAGLREDARILWRTARFVASGLVRRSA